MTVPESDGVVGVSPAPRSFFESEATQLGSRKRRYLHLIPRTLGDFSYAHPCLANPNARFIVKTYQ